MVKRLAVCSMVAFGLLTAGQGYADGWRQIPGVVHLHSTFSSGRYSLEQLVSKARQRGIEVLVPTDHDLVVMEYGLFPLRNIIKRKEERSSILKVGPEKYLAEIQRLNNAQSDVVLLPGAQSSPYYYWSGNPFNGSLTAHNYRKELLLIGLQRPEDYRDLPVLHGNFSTRYFGRQLPQAILFLAAFVLGVLLVFQKRRYKIIGGLIGVFSLLLLFNHHPFRSSPFDAYHGDQGSAPYQEMIDYMNRHNGLVFWAHPGSRYSRGGRQLGPVTLKTKPYDDELLNTSGYSGFSSIYGDSAALTDPGRQWDQVLLQYCRGERPHPVWGIAGADFHREKKGVEIDTFQTVFLVRRKSPKAILSAMAAGRMYAVRKESGDRLTLEGFRITDSSTTAMARMGEEIALGGMAMIEGSVSVDDGSRQLVEVSLIRAGKVWHQFEGSTPLAFEFVDREKSRRKTYYRIVVRARGIGKLVSNPIFVKAK